MLKSPRLQSLWNATALGIVTVTGTLALCLVTASAAFASGMPDDATKAQITEKLTAEGYEVRRIDMEDGMIEVYALKDGKKLELYLDEALNIAKVHGDD
ncbi:PepSY domain-containing protein [Pseudooceanicola sp. 502str34]|uniref:PepSY domain-containing protein n=1 Tax=Maritimibacter alkaliphilus TaxID=404236 RepID=UPI001C96476C|nr:PepSY domain-containing protein [Maritimibacter alkaliphilus]MBY6089460.1 PepSY domain-containing protein [Maritimibacter alkaliphilus]